MLILEPPRELLERWFPGREVRCLGRLDGGWLNDVFRVSTDGDDYVLRLCMPETTVEMVLWEHDLLDHIGPKVAEVPTPLPAPDGVTAVEYDGRVASVFPYIEGEAANRYRRQHRIAAGHTLARIHHASAKLHEPGERPGHPALWRLDWRENRWWHWSRARARFPALAETAPEDLEPMAPEIAGIIERELALLPAALSELRWRRLPVQPLHGDYWPGNLRVVDDHVTGVFDWDEARLDWRACDVADAVWAFSRKPRKDAIDYEAAGEFLDAYFEAGGAVSDSEWAVLVLLMRARRLWEALYDIGAWQRGEEMDWSYLAANVRALQHLEGIEALDTV